MEYSLISSANDLDLCTNQRYHMVLAWACTHEGYKSFYKNLSSENYRARIILDNGANEGKLVEGPDYVALAHKLSAYEIIAPDVYQDCDATIQKTMDFLNAYTQELKDIKIMAVPQGRTPAEYLKCWKTFLEDKRISTLGLGYRNILNCVKGDMLKVTDKQWENLLGYHYFDIKRDLPESDFLMTLSRLFFLTRINIKEVLIKYEKEIHLLGLWNPVELVLINKAFAKEELDVIRSCDSASPVQAAQSYVKFNGYYGLKTKPQAMLDMFMTLGSEQRRIAERNLHMLRIWAQP